MLKPDTKILAALAIAFATSWPSAVAAVPFTLVLLPDTQHYSDSATNIANFEAQTQWISDQRVANNIVFSTLVGDVVQNGGQGAAMNQVEWDRAVGALDTLHDDPADPAYATITGNHDYDIVFTKSSATQYIANLGPARYAGKTWFLAAAPDQVNMAQEFVGDGKLFLHIGLEWLPSDDALAFAQSLIAANPTIPVVLSTHEHLGNSNPAVRRTSGATPDATGDNAAEDVYRKLIEPFPQVFLVLSGHWYGYGRLDSTTVLGRPVHEVMANFQNDPNGGNGWMQLLEFRPDNDEIAFETISPTYIRGTPGPNRSLDSAGNFTMPFDLNELRSYLETRVVLHYRQGQDNGFGAYAGALDTHLGDGAAGVTFPGVAYGDADNVRMDAGSDHEQGLLRFDGIVGGGPGQIPPGKVIQKAILTLTTEGGNADGHGAGLHRMLVPWDGSSTWNSLGAGVQLGGEALAAADRNTGSVEKGTRSYDVTASVQAWVDGATNHGWLLLANGNDRWEFRSSDWSGLTERPMLTVDYSPAPIPPTPVPFVQAGHYTTGYSGGVPLTVPSIDPAGITFHPPSGHLFITDSEIDEVAAAFGQVGANLFEVSQDGSTLYNAWDLTALGNDEPSGITYNEFDGHFYLTNSNTGSVHRYAFDGTTFNEVDSFAMPIPPGGGTADPEGLASDPATGRMWAVDGLGRAIVTFTYDAVGGLTVESNIDLTITIPDPAERPQKPEGIAYSPDSGQLYLVSAPEQALFEITTAGMLAARYDLWSFSPAVVAPRGISVAPTPVGPRPAVRLLLVDGGVDNDQDPNERDGSVYTADILTFVCSDGIDNDLDNAIDLADLGCTDAFDLSEEPDCQDGWDNDGDGAIDFPWDGGCSGSSDLSENDPNRTCDDGLDNDGDGLLDFRVDGFGDPGCGGASWPIEDPQCQDGIDNDGFLGTDYDGGESILGVGNGDPNGPDPQCIAFWDYREAGNVGGCGMGPELGLLLPLLAVWRRRRQG